MRSEICPCLSHPLPPLCRCLHSHRACPASYDALIPPTTSPLNFFYDQSRQTGSVNRFAVITSDSLWHVRLMEDAAATGLMFTEKVDPAVYGKKGNLYQKPVAGASENATYDIFHYSIPGHVDVEIGYASGIDI